MLGCTPYFMNFAIQNFPFIEDKFDGVTDYQLMCKIFKYLDNEIKKVDSKYEGVFDIVSKLEEDFEELKVDINQKLVQFQNTILSQVDTKNEALYNRVISLMNDYQIVFKAYVDSQIQVVNNRIDDIEAGAVQVYNPMTGQIEPISKVIDDLYNQLRYDAISCSEYDGLELTADDYDGYMITANNFDLNGKSILMGN